MGLMASLFFGFVPMLVFAYILYWLDRFEKEPKILLGLAFIWGALVAAGVAFVVNTAFGLGVYFVTGSETATEFATGSLVAPPVEEFLKGLAVVLVFWIFHAEFDSILDGIVYAGITALGFAATENAYYIYNYGYLEGGYEGLLFLVFVRVILVGWQHPFYTAFIGIGLAIARLNRAIGIKILAPLAGFTLGVVTHSLHNTLASLLPGLGGFAIGTLLDWSGWFLMFLVIVWAIWRVQQRIKRYLKAEVQNGLISAQHYRTATSAIAQSAARLVSIFSGQYRATSRFYHLCAELAHKKFQLEYFGEERGNSKQIAKLRAEIGQLAPHAKI